MFFHIHCDFHKWWDSLCIVMSPMGFTKLIWGILDELNRDPNENPISLFFVLIGAIMTAN